MKEVVRKSRIDSPQGCIATYAYANGSVYNIRKNTYFGPSMVIPGWENNQNGTFCVHYFRKAYKASEKAKNLKFLR
jgi:hypothetical protein